MRSDRTLRNAIAGAVSIAMDGSDFAISLGRSLKLDDTHQVHAEHILLPLSWALHPEENAP